MGPSSSVSKQPSQKSEDAYDLMLLKYKSQQKLLEEIKIKNIQNPPQKQGKLLIYQASLQKTISDSLVRQKKFLDNFKIYNLFLGSSNSGKSTLINALVGFEVIPINCEVLKNIIIEVQHSEDVIYNYVRVQLKEIEINQQQNIEIFNCSSNELQSFLESKDLSLVQSITFEVSSYFHNQFNKELRSHLILVDIPGFQINGDTKTETKQFLRKVEEFFTVNSDTEETVILSNWVLDQTAINQENEPHFMYIMEKLQKEYLDVQENANSFLQASEDDGWIIGSQEEEEKIKMSSVEIQSRIRNSLTNITLLINKCDLTQELGIQSQKILNRIIELTKQYHYDPHIFRISAKEALTFNLLSYASSDIKQLYCSSNKLDQSQFAKKANLFIASQDYIYYQNYLMFLIQENLNNIMYPLQKQFDSNLQLLNLFTDEVTIVLTEKDQNNIQAMKESLDYRLQNFSLNARIKSKLWDLEESKIQTIKQTKNLKLKQNLCKSFLSSSIIKFEELNEIFKKELFDQYQAIYMLLMEDGQTKFERQSQYIILQNEPWYSKGIKQILEFQQNLQLDYIQKVAFQNFSIQMSKIEALDIKSLRQGSELFTELQNDKNQNQIIKIGLNFFEMHFNENPKQYELIDESIDFWGKSYEQLKQDLQKSYENFFQQSLETLYIYLSNLSNI